MKKLSTEIERAWLIKWNDTKEPVAILKDNIEAAVIANVMEFYYIKSEKVMLEEMILGNALLNSNTFGSHIENGIISCGSGTHHLKAFIVNNLKIHTDDENKEYIEY